MHKVNEITRVSAPHHLIEILAANLSAIPGKTCTVTTVKSRRPLLDSKNVSGLAKRREAEKPLNDRSKYDTLWIDNDIRTIAARPAYKPKLRIHTTLQTRMKERPSTLQEFNDS